MVRAGRRRGSLHRAAALINALIQVSVEDRLRGQVMSIYSLINRFLPTNKQ